MKVYSSTHLMARPFYAFSRLVLLLALFFVNACISATDKCESVVCETGRYCADGKCVCPEGYTGAECLQQIPPTSIRITKIEVLSYPWLSIFGPWDTDSPPDLQLELFYLGNVVIWESPVIENADSGVVHTFIPQPAIELVQPTTVHSINVNDFDSIGAVQYMTGFIFTPYSSSNNFPASITYDHGVDGAIRLHLSYKW